MAQFSNVTYTGTFTGTGAGTDEGFPGTATITGPVTAVLSEAANGSITGTYTYSGSSSLFNAQFGTIGGPSFGGGGTISGTQSGLSFTATSGPLNSGSGSISSDDTTITFSDGWVFASGGLSGSGSASGSLHGSPSSPPPSPPPPPPPPPPTSFPFSYPATTYPIAIPPADTWTDNAVSIGGGVFLGGPQFNQDAYGQPWSLATPPNNGTADPAWSGGGNEESLLEVGAESSVETIVSALENGIVPGEAGLVEAVDSAETAAGIFGAEVTLAHDVLSATALVPTAMQSLFVNNDYSGVNQIESSLQTAKTKFLTSLGTSLLSTAVGSYLGGVFKNAIWGSADGAQYFFAQVGSNTLTASGGANYWILGSGAGDTINLGPGNVTVLEPGGNNQFVKVGAGNDMLAGSAGGLDTMIYSASAGAFSASHTAAGALQLTGPLGTDTLDRVDQVRFSYGVLDTAYDFDGGGTSGLLLRNSSNGQFEVYDIANNAITFAQSMGQVGLEWQIAGLGDFTGSGGTDMLMRDTITGQFEVYDIANNAITFAQGMGQVGLEWQIAGFGDFTGSGLSDMLMRNVHTGALEFYDIANNTIIAAGGMGQVGLEWQVAGFGDFASDGTTDMLMRNSNTGQFEIYDIRNNQITSAASMGQVGLEWQVVGFGDFAGNGTSDMLMRNSHTGQFELYDISNNRITSAASMGQVGLEWQVIEFGTFNGDFTADMLMQNVNTGKFEVYDINNNQITSATGMGQVGTQWIPSGPSNLAGVTTAQITQAMAAFAPADGVPPVGQQIDLPAVQASGASLFAASSSPRPGA